MEYRTLGTSGLRISTLTFGTMAFGGKGNFAKVGNTSLKDAKQMVDMCLDYGVNIFDTADVYSSGESEIILGQALNGRPQEILVTSKVRFRMDRGPNGEGLSRFHIIKACENSLLRLKRDHIDLYYLHEWDGLTRTEETLEAMDTLTRSGKIRYFGVSNFSAWHLSKFLSTAERLKFIPPICQQIYYSLQSREAEYELLPLSLDQGLGVQVWSPLAGGLLSGKYRRGTSSPEETRFFANWSEPPVYDQEKLYDTVETIISISQQKNVAPAQIAYAWLLQRPAITSIVLGARTKEQLQTNLETVNVTLNDAEFSLLDKVSAPTLIYPYWHQAQNAYDRLTSHDLVAVEWKKRNTEKTLMP